MNLPRPTDPGDEDRFATLGDLITLAAEPESANDGAPWSRAHAPVVVANLEGVSSLNDVRNASSAS
jgi:hypothetical protein